MSGQRKPALWVACGLASLWLLAPSAAYADLARASNNIVGERPLGLGGAFTGLADSPAASYYNPAGLAHLPRRSVSASLSLQVVERLRIDDAYLTTAGPADIESRGTPVLPVFSSVVSKFGPRDRFGVRRFAFAFSTIQPNRSAWRAVIDERSMSPNIQDSLVVSQDHRETWYGLSFAYRMNPNYAFGLTAFLANSSFTHTEELTRIEEGMVDPMRGTLENPYFTITDSLAEASAWNLVFRVGALMQPSPRLRIGAMFQTPGIQVHGEGRIRERTSFADLIADPGYATFYLSDQGDLPVDIRIPWQARLGAALQASDSVLFTADVEAVGSFGSPEDPVSLIDLLALDEVNGATPEPGVFYPENLSHETHINASLGLEWQVTPSVPLRLGAFTSFPGSSPIPEQPLRYHPPRLNYYGATAAVGYAAGDYDLTLGCAGRFGAGEAVAYNPTGMGFDYQATTAEAWSLHIFIGGYRRAAQTLARNVVRRIRDRRRTNNPQMNSEGEPPSIPSPPSEETPP